MEELAPEDEDAPIPCGWKFVAIGYLLPITIGGLNGCHWAAATFLFQENGWDLSYISAITFAGFICRPFVTRSLVSLGMWMTVPIAVLHLLCAGAGLLFPDREWAVLTQIWAVLCLDIYVGGETLAFITFGDTEKNAKIACGAVTQTTVISYACSSTVCRSIMSPCRDDLRQLCFGKKPEEVTSEVVDAVADTKDTTTTLAPPIVRPRADTAESSNSASSNGSERPAPVARGRRGSLQSRVSLASMASRPGHRGAPGQGARQLKTTISGRRASVASMATLVDDLALVPEMTPEIEAHGVDPQGKQTKGRTPLPKDLYLPAALLGILSMANFFTYQVEWCTYALYFKDVHGWRQATWSGLAQTAGDVLAAVVMKIQNCFSQKSIDDADQYAKGGSSWLLASVLGKPYMLSVGCLAYSAVCFGMTSSSLVIAMTSQVLMGSVFVIVFQAITTMNTFYSLGDSSIFLQLQVMKQNAESVGSALAGLVSLVLYQQLGPTAPFWLTGCLFVGVFFIYTAGFCSRVGFGKHLDGAEAARAQRRGVERRITWSKGKSQESLDGHVPDIQINVIPPKEDDEVGSTVSI
eukprot:s379_g9.t1